MRSCTADAWPIPGQQNTGLNSVGTGMPGDHESVSPKLHSFGKDKLSKDPTMLKQPFLNSSGAPYGISKPELTAAPLS